MDVWRLACDLDAFWRIFVVFCWCYNASLTYTTTYAAAADPGGAADRSLTYSIAEGKAKGSFVGNTVTDLGIFSSLSGADFNKLSFVILNSSQANSELFAIDEKSGRLTTAAIIDRDVICLRQPTCFVTLDIAVQPQQFFRIIKVVISIDDVNDNSPTFSPSTFYERLSESAPLGELFPLPAATDADGAPQNGVVNYQLLPSDVSSPFRLQMLNSTRNGAVLLDLRLMLVARLDREKQSTYALTLVAYDGGAPPRTGSLAINLTIEDVNDNSPQFDNATYLVRVPENAPVGSRLVRLHATDADSGVNALLQYKFSTRSQNLYGSYFAINSDTGDVTLSKALSYAMQSTFNLSVVAVDSGPSNLPATAGLYIVVVHVNLLPPSIVIDYLNDEGPPVKISRSSPSDTLIAYLTITDPDGVTGPDSPVNCTLSPSQFSLVHVSRIDYKIATTVSFSKPSTYVLFVTCVDLDQPPLTSVQTLTVVVAETSDQPLAFTAAIYSASLSVNNAKNAVVLTVRANDPDAGVFGSIKYSLADSSFADRFSLDPDTGTLTASVTFTPAALGQVEFKVVATKRRSNGTLQTATSTVRISLLSTDPALMFDRTSPYVFNVSESVAVKTEVGRLTASIRLPSASSTTPATTFVGTGSSMSIMYSFVNAQNDFSLDENTGRIYTRNILDRELIGSYSLSVKAAVTTQVASSPARSMSLTATTLVILYVLDVNDNAPTVTFPTPGNNTIYVPYDLAVGGLVTRVTAYDADDVTHDNSAGSSVQLTYSMRPVNDWFDVTTTTGHILLKSDLSQVVNQSFTLNVVVSDGVHETYVSFQAIVSEFSALVGARRTTDTSTDTTRIIILACVLSACLVLICLIVTAILLVCRRRKQPRRGSQAPPVYWTSVQLSDSERSPCDDLTERAAMAGDDEFRIRNQLDLLEDVRKSGSENRAKQNLYQTIILPPELGLPPRPDGSSDSSDSGCPDHASSQASSSEGGDGSKRSSKSSDNGASSTTSPPPLLLQKPSNLVLAATIPFNSPIPEWLRNSRGQLQDPHGSLDRPPRQQVYSPQYANAGQYYTNITPPGPNNNYSTGSIDRRNSATVVQPRTPTMMNDSINYPDVMRPGSFRSSLYNDPYRGSIGTNRFEVNPASSTISTSNTDVSSGPGHISPRPYPSSNAYDNAQPLPQMQKSSLLRTSSRKSVRFAGDNNASSEGIDDDGSMPEAKKRVHFAEHDQLAYLESSSALSDLSGSDGRDDVSRTSSDVTNNEYIITPDRQYTGANALGVGGEPGAVGNRGRGDPLFEITDTDQTHNHSPPSAVFGGTGTGRYPPPDVPFGNFRPEDGSLV